MVRQVEEAHRYRKGFRHNLPVGRIVSRGNEQLRSQVHVSEPSSSGLLQIIAEDGVRSAQNDCQYHIQVARKELLRCLHIWRL